jgi:hypothetical protein
MTVTVRIENTYEDGHESVLEVEVESPEVPTDLEEWWEERVWEHTGDGHALGSGMGAWYEATIIEADDASLVGLSMEWG